MKIKNVSFIGLTSWKGMTANWKGEYLMYKWFHSGGTYDFGANGRQGEKFDVPGYSQKLSSDQATDVLVGIAAGYATFKTGTPGYAFGVGAASTYFGVIDFGANAVYSGKAQAITGIVTATYYEFNGFYTGAMDALDDGD